MCAHRVAFGLNAALESGLGLVDLNWGWLWDLWTRHKHFGRSPDSVGLTGIC